MVDVWETCVKMSTISCHAMIGFECTIGVWVDWEIWGGCVMRETMYGLCYLKGSFYDTF